MEALFIRCKASDQNRSAVPEIHIDHRLTEGIQHKLMMKLLEFDFKIQYKKGVLNKVADALSRKVHQLMSISAALPVWAQDLFDSYKQDTFYKPILGQLLLQNNTASTDYSYHFGIIIFKGKIVVGNNGELKQKLLSTLHDSPIGRHSGMRATYHRIKTLFYWLGMNFFVETYIAQCPIGQREKGEHCFAPRILEPLHVADMAWQHITMDFIEGLPNSNGKDVIMVVVDRFTKYAHFIPLSHPYSINSVDTTFLDNILKLHGPPKLIISDRDRIFTSQIWKDIFAAFKIELRYSSAYHPQTDGQSERVNQCLETYLRCRTSSQPKKWLSWLPLAEYW